MQRFLRLPFELRLGKNRIKEHTVYIGMKAPRTKVRFKLGKCSTVQAKQSNASPLERLGWLEGGCILTIQGRKPWKEWIPSRHITYERRAEQNKLYSHFPASYTIINR
jgi:hypothetical protein